MSIDLGIENGFSHDDTRLLGLAGLLHDIGKIHIPKEILYKKSSLNPEELKIMRAHPRLGFIELDDFEYDKVRLIVVSHHEYKPNPYPRSGEDRRKSRHSAEDRRMSDGEIGIMAQIVAVSDIYDALASRRSYKEPLSTGQIEEILIKQFKGDHRYIEQVLRRCAAD